MNNKFRIKGYDQKHNVSFVLDSYGMFEKKWQFSSYLVQHGLKIIDIEDIADADNLPNDSEHLYLRKSENSKNI